MEKKNVLMAYGTLIILLTFSILFSSESADQGCHGDKEQQTDPEDSPCYADGETPLTQSEQHIQQSQNDTQVSGGHKTTHKFIIPLIYIMF